MSFKSETNKQLLDYYNSNGLQKLVGMARKCLELPTNKENTVFRTHVHGEIAETVLECILEEYIKVNNLNRDQYFVSKGLILKDVDNPTSGYFTELDVTFFTPKRIYAFESKSYSGDKRIIKECTIRKKTGNAFDVFSQHQKHVLHLCKNLSPFRINQHLDTKYSPYRLILFDFALGTVKDIREDKWKLIMPILNETNVLNIFHDIDKIPVMWDMKYVKRAVEVIEKNKKINTAKHLDYVTSLNRNRNTL